MTTELPERLDLRSHDIAADKRAALIELFPEIRTENGQIDVDQLKRALGEAVDPGKERYGLTWPGKADCFKAIQTPSLGTLLPAPDQSVNWDTTENLIIEGDNLEVLKLLQKSYLGKVKMIYIDPPYNTGNDFIYPDDYAESLKTYLEYTGQVDAEGRKFSTNTDTDGRFHSKWLNMMYPRLYLARNLLRDDGVIFISINDSELANLVGLCDEVFGEENRVEVFIWENTFRPSNMSRRVRDNAEYVLCYTRSSGEGLEMVERHQEPQGDASLTKKSNRPRPLLFPGNYVRVGLPDGDYPPAVVGEVELQDTLVVRDGLAVEPFRIAGRFAWSQEYLDAEIEDGVTLQIKTTSFIPYYRKADQEVAVRPTKILAADLTGDILAARAEMLRLFGEPVYDYPKPSSLVKTLASTIGVAGEDIVVDFFAGSGTTAHAVLDLNAQDGGNRKFILVQLPEPTDGGDYPTIAEITKERVRRVIAKLNEKGEIEGEDRGFRVLKLAESNFRIWKADVPHQMEDLVEQLELHVAHVNSDRSAIDVLFEILLKSGYSLTTRVEQLDIDGKAVYSIAEGALLVSIDRGLTLGAIRGMADREPKPERVVCLDDAFAGDDQLKANAAQLFKTRNIVFRTV